MTEHYTSNTESVTRHCNQCNRPARHSVTSGRVGRCLEHDAPQFSKKQLANRSRLARESATRGEGLFK